MFKVLPVIIVFKTTQAEDETTMTNKTDSTNEKPEEKDKGGRPVKPVDYVTLDKLCGLQCTGEECAAILDMHYDTLNRKIREDHGFGFTEYFKNKSASGRLSLRRKQYEVAQAGSVPMLIWLGKQYLGQSEKQETDITSGGDKLQHPGYTIVTE